MLLEENQISFHSDDGVIVDGVKDYSHKIAEMIGLGSDGEFHEAGVSLLYCALLYFSFPFCYQTTLGSYFAKVGIFY